MPSKLKIWPNERVDIPDFEHAANTYTADSTAFLAERLLLDKRARVVDGFRIQIDDQSVNPGQITVYNGNALNREGFHVNDESLAELSTTVTLVGAATTFYLEVERVEVESTTDGRAFFDPTFDNGGPPTPDGREVSLTVATRIEPVWRIVRPVSTTGFQSTTNPNSNRIPLAILTTDGSNEITNVSTVGLVTQQASTVLESDILAGVTAVRCLDARTFNIGDTITIGFGGGAPDTARVISNIDADNNIITFAPATGNTHQAGAIIRRTAGGAANLLVRNTDPTFLNTHPDRTPRLFQGNETRGSALASSSSTFGDIDDLSLRSLKDYVDFVAGQIRELKFGAARRDALEGNVPTAFDSPPRYYDPSGGVQGARAHTVSIGDGTNSFGDFNGTDETPFIAALAYLSSFTPNTGKIVVKNGTYTFANTVVLSDRVKIQGTTRDATILVNNTASGLFELDAGASDVIELEELQIQGGTGNVHINVTGPGRLYLRKCTVLSGYIAHDATGIDARVYIDDCRFIVTQVAYSVNTENVFISNCQISASVAVFVGSVNSVSITDSTIAAPYVFFVADAEDAHVSNCTITANIVFGITNDSSSISVTSCKLTGSLSTTLVVTVGMGTHTQHTLSDNIITVVSSGTTEASPINITLYSGTTTDILVSGNNIQTDVVGGYCSLMTVSGSINRCLISGNLSHNCLTRVLHGLASSSIANTSIVDNTITSSSLSTVTNEGLIRFDSTATSVSGVKIDNNRILDLNLASGPAAVVWLDGASPRVLDITNNFFSTSSVNGRANCVLLGLATSAAHVSKISGNTLLSSGVVSPTTAIYGNITSAGTLHVTDNRIQNVVGAVDVHGIYITGSVNSKVDNNLIEAVSAVGAGPVTGIYVGSATASSVTGNTVRGISSTTASSLNSVIRIVEPVKVRVTSNTLEGSTNVVNTLYAATTAAVPICSIAIIGNTIVGGTETTGHIYVTTAVNSAWNGLTVHDNTIYIMSTAVTLVFGVGLFLLGGATTERAISVCNNNIVEAAYNARTSGIYINSLGTNVSGVAVSGNTLHGLVPNATGRLNSAIYIVSVNDVVVNGNNVFWNSPSSGAEVDVVFIDTCARGIVSGNKINPSNGADEIDVSTSTSFFVDSNYVGDGVTTGNINPAATAGTITIGTNKLL